MRSDLDHLPPHKQRELERVVQIIFEEFGDAVGMATQEWKRKARIEKIVLYGSYARGTWVDEPHTAKGYQSDYDLLIVVSDKRLTDRVDYWLKLEARLDVERAIKQTLRTPVNFILHTFREVNENLAQGRYFFMDIARDGIVLYETDKVDFREPEPKTPADALAMAREYFEEWLPSASDFFDGHLDARARGKFKKAVFDLHQAAERYYYCVLLVMTFYTPHVHNIGFLRTQAERIDPRLIDVWPREVKVERSRFEKLKEAYIKARYSKHYRIDEEALVWLGERVEILGQIVETICSERLAALEAKAT